METGRSRPSWNIAKLNSPFHTVILVCLVALLSYLAPKLAGALLLHPQTVWPLWPGCALLVPVLLLVPRRIWPIVIPAAFAAFVLYDLQAGVPVRSIAWFIPADTVEVLIAAFGLSYFSDRMPRLNSLKALGKYLFFVALLAPFTAAFLSAPGIRSDYWTGWKICFFSEVLALVTLTPAILGWVTDGPAWVRKSRAYHLEFAGLMAGLVLLSYITFTIPESSSSPALLYSLVPFLLWAALRFGSMGVSSSVVVVAFLSIWGAVHGRGPFTNGGLFSSVLSLQLFLVFAAIPFMVLAALVEERKRVEEVLRESEERLRLAMEVGKLGGWEWDIKSGRNPWFGEAHTLLGMTAATRSGSVQDFWDRVHPENLGQLRKAMETARQNHGEFDQEFRVVWPDGTLRWLRSQGRFFYAPDGEPERMLGISKDITKRKQVEQALRQSEAELMEAQRLANVGSWRWDLSTDTVTWSEELYRIAGLDPGLPAVSYKEHSKLYTAESWDCLRRAVEEALRTGTPYELDLEMIRFDGARRWLIAKGEARRDSTGHVVQLRGTVHDVTERKRTEEALRESQERLRLAQEAVHVGVFEWDVQKNENHWSPELERIYGLTPGSFGGTYEAWIERVHPDDRKRFKWDDQRNVQEGGLFDSEYRIVRPSGEILWLYSRVNLSCDSAGRPVRMLGFAIDITERKRAAEALRESEARERAKVKELETLLDAAPITILIATDAECKCITANRTGSQLHNVPLGANFSRSAIPVGLPLPFRIMRDGVEIPTEELPLQRAAATGIPVLGAFSTVVSEDGTEHHMIGNAAPLFDEDGKPRGAVGAFVDITERKRAEEALRESENKLRLLLDSTAEAIYGIDLEGRCTFCNPACLRALGYERDDGLIGKNMHHLIHHTHTDGTLYPVEECRIFRALRTGEGVHVDDEVLWRANRTSFPAEYWSYPQRRGQEIVGAVVAFIDITERKVAEVALASVSRRLIEAQEQERTRIARELHDDIGQRLALLTIELEQLQQNSPDLPAEVRSRVGVLREQVSGVATDVQSLSHELHSSKLEYLGIATALRAFCEEFSDQQNVEVVFAHDEVPRTLPQGISLCLFRVLQEALHNAVKHSGARRFDVELRVTSNQIQLTVRDSGSGFDVAEAMKTHGLGLVSMAERLKLVDGQLSIDSQPQRGATICASIPLGKVARASV